KVTVERPRPLIHFTSTPTKTFAPPPEPGWGRERSHGPMQLRTRPLTKRSFPSGHAQYAFTWMVFMALLLPQGAIPFVTLACLVALSRVVLGVHFPLDVVVGALCGTAFGWIGFTVGSAWERRANPDCDPSDGEDACGVA
ncbi:MAG: phosphatase PAP2 family protein, partial [Myxococcota bacterium]